ncbi:hypothetical protein Csa_017252, partial [Cucumis sativus]
MKFHLCDSNIPREMRNEKRLCFRGNIVVRLVNPHELQGTGGEKTSTVKIKPGNPQFDRSIVGPRKKHIGYNTMGAMFRNSLLKWGLEQRHSRDEFGNHGRTNKEVKIFTAIWEADFSRREFEYEKVDEWIRIVKGFGNRDGIDRCCDDGDLDAT